MVNFGCAGVVEEDADNIETGGSSLLILSCKVILGNFAYLMLFPEGYSCGWRTEQEGFAGLYLNKDQAGSIISDEVNLSQGTAIIAVDNRIALHLKVMPGYLFAATAKLLLFIHHCR